MDGAFSIVLLFILLDCMTNINSLTLKGYNVPLTAFYPPVKALYIKARVQNHALLMTKMAKIDTLTL